MKPFTEREELTAKPPEKISSKEWGEKNRELSVLTSSSAGRWTANMIPFFVPVLDALDDDDIEIVVLQKSTQIAGTETFLTWLGKVADQDPGPAMMCFADEDTADEVVERRVQPLFRTAAPIARHIEESKFNKKSITLLNNFSLTPAWASSISKTASRPIRYLYLSEITKPGYGKSGDEGSVLTRIFQRTETFPNKKIAIETTPTVEGDNIDKQMSLCEVIYDWHVPCPKCGIHQVLRFRPTKYRNSSGQEAMSGGVVWEDRPEIADEKQRIRLESETARYRCGECGELWTTAEKNAAVSRGKAYPRTLIERKPRRVGFHISRLYSLFPGGRLESLALSFLEAKSDPAELQSFVNNSLAEHWKTTRETGTEQEMRGAICDNETGTMPESADCITVQVDMQQTGFWYVVRAWSAFSKDSWLIECGQLATWDDVSDLFFERTWPNEAGEGMYCWRGALDIGGSKEEGKEVSRTEEAYEWYISEWHRARRRVYLCKGSSRALPTSLNVGKILEVTPSGKKIDRWGLQILELNTTRLKNLFFHGLKQAREKASKAAYISKGIPDQYFRHITAEVIDANGEYKKIRPDNHWLDCEMMGYGIVSRELVGGLDGLARALGEHRKTEKKPEIETEKQPEIPEKQPETQTKPAEIHAKPAEKQPEMQPKQAAPARRMGSNPWTRGTRF